MGEWGDYGAPEADPANYGIDTAPTGAGADPFGGTDDPYGTGDPYNSALPGGTAEEWSTGMLPGGADGQLSPYSPGGGWDATNIFSRPAAWLGAGRGFAGMGTGSMPVGGAGGLMVPMRRAYGGGAAVTLGAQSTSGDIVRWVRQNSGLRVTARSIVGLIIRYGFKAAAALTQLDPSYLLSLFMQQKGVVHHRRGPGLYTLARKFRKYESLKRTVARVLGRGGGGHRHRRGGFHHMRRRSRRRR